MTSVDLLRTCFVSACANALFNKRDTTPLNHTAAVVARRTTRLNAAPSPHRLRRLPPATSTTTPIITAASARRRRTSFSVYHPASLRKPSHSFTPLPPTPKQLPTRRAEVTRRPQTPKNRDEMDEMVLLQRSLDESRRNASTPEEKRHPGRADSRDDTKPRRLPDGPLASPPSLVDDPVLETRSTRSASTTSRSTNRLSLTLPIMPPTAYSARPTPATATGASFPPTPLDTPSLMSPIDPNDFITAIAAQERYVLELREALGRAESDLTTLKKQWANHEAYKKRSPRRNVEPIPGLGAAAELQDEAAIRRSAEMDRRKALLGQQSQLSTPERSRRRVYQGCHARKLSLLSPTKADGESFADGDEPEGAKLDSDPRFTASMPSKRASWAARPTQATGVKQLAEDLKSGIWTFMEDLRQATVGDEPITGQGNYMRGTDGNMRVARSNTGDQDTIRAKGPTRPRVGSAFDEMPTPSKQPLENGDDSDSPSDGPRPPLPLRRSKTDAGTRTAKRFSWSPLSMDSFDDNDWSNWNSPSVSSPRWSGTTVNGDIIPSVPEKRDDDIIDCPSPL